MAEKHPQPRSNQRMKLRSGAARTASGGPGRMRKGEKGEKCEFSLSDALLGIRWNCMSHRPAAGGHGSIRHVAPGIVYRGREEEVRRLFGILFDNAMKYSTKDTEFIITLLRRKKPPVSYDIHQ